MPLAGWVRARVRRSSNWCAELAALRQELAAERRSPAAIERTCELAGAMEYCDPDRGRALTLYLDAWRGGHQAAVSAARRLASELGAHMTLAELALAEGDLFGAGTAFLDAGFPALAVEPLERFVAARPAGASVMTESLRTQGAAALLAIARGQRFDAAREIDDSLVHARHSTGSATAAAAFLHAARVARAAGLDNRCATILVAASHACPEDDAIAALVEARLFERASTDELLAHYSSRLELTSSRAQYCERARAAGVELIARNLQPGLGLRLLRMSLEHAYTALLPDIRSHIAAWELLWTHAEAQHATCELGPLVAHALSAPLPEDDAFYLANRGLEVAWRHASDPVAAKPYAAMVLDFVADHPLAVAFVREAAPEMVTEVPVAAPAPPPALVKTTARIPVLEGQVKRVVPALAEGKQPRGITGRMALLAAPQPRCAPSPPPPAYVARAPRKVSPVDAVIELPGGGFFSTVLRDLSMSGAFIVTKRHLEVETIMSLEVKMPSPGTITLTNHRTNARVARRTELGCGLAFVDPSPALVAAIRALLA